MAPRFLISWTTARGPAVRQPVEQLTCPSWLDTEPRANSTSFIRLNNSIYNTKTHTESMECLDRVEVSAILEASRLSEEVVMVWQPATILRGIEKRPSTKTITKRAEPIRFTNNTRPIHRRYRQVEWKSNHRHLRE